jgi:hypothetical protein
MSLFAIIVDGRELTTETGHKTLIGVFSQSHIRVYLEPVRRNT